MVGDKIKRHVWGGSSATICFGLCSGAAQTEHSGRDKGGPVRDLPAREAVEPSTNSGRDNELDGDKSWRMDSLVYCLALQRLWGLEMRLSSSGVVYWTRTDCDGLVIIPELTFLAVCVAPRTSVADSPARQHWQECSMRAM